MKKVSALFLVAVLLLSAVLAGCSRKDSSVNGSAGEKTGKNDKLTIVATIFPPYDFARQITGGKAGVTMLLPPASESHSFEPTPQDIITIQNCDVFIYVGGESDQWVNKVLASMDTSKIKIITLMDCVDVVEEETVEGMQPEEGEESEPEQAEEPEYDEHVWTSPQNAMRIVQKISDALCTADTVNAPYYQENTAAYLSQLSQLDAEFRDVVDHAQRKTIVFGDRFPFRYFTEAYGLKYYAAFPGCSTDTEANAQTVKFLVDKIKAEKIPVVFHIELSNQKMAEAISEATGAKVLLLHACHNISKDDFEKGIGYVDLMKKNVASLKEALQ